MAAIAAARHAGVPVDVSLDALTRFKGVKRRMELRGEVNGVRVYDDFAHHPTAITLTLEGLRKRVGDERIIAVLEPRSNTMRPRRARPCVVSNSNFIITTVSILIVKLASNRRN